MTTKLNIMFLCCLFLTACSASRQNTATATSVSAADSTITANRKQVIASLASDSIGLEYIEIKTNPADSTAPLTVKIARLSRSARKTTASSDSMAAISSTKKDRSSHTYSTNETETQSPARQLLPALVLAAILAIILTKYSNDNTL